MRIELDAFRAEEARLVLDHVIQGNCFDVHSAVESFSLLFENPPYDFEIGENRNGRMEYLFLEHTYRWLKPGGVLVLVIPGDRLATCAEILAVHFRDKALYRLSEPESIRYKQIVVFGVRRTRREREQLKDWDAQPAKAKLLGLSRNYEELPALPDEADKQFAVPPSGPAQLVFRGIPLDTVEDLLAGSAAYRQANRILFAPEVRATGRPLTPLHGGHVGLLTTSGLLNGIFGQGPDLHVARWESVKVTDRIEETDENEVTTIRERERFTQCSHSRVCGRYDCNSRRKEQGFMKNAHLRLGSLQFTKVLRDTTIDITVRMDRMIAEHDAENRSARCHLLSVIGNDQEIAAIAAAISEEARFYANGPEVNRLMITLGQRGGSLSGLHQHSGSKAAAAAPGCDVRRTVQDARRGQSNGEANDSV